MTTRFALALLAAGALTMPAMAFAMPGSETAVQSVESAARLAPDDSGAMIELAAAYQRAGRTADANTAFRRALTLDNRMLETPTGDAVWSHEVARHALARDVALTAR